MLGVAQFLTFWLKKKVCPEMLLQNIRGDFGFSQGGIRNPLIFLPYTCLATWSTYRGNSDMSYGSPPNFSGTAALTASVSTWIGGDSMAVAGDAYLQEDEVKDT